MMDVLQQLTYIAAMVVKAADADSLEQVLENIAGVSRELVGAKYAALGIPDESGHTHRYFKVSGISQEQVAHIEHLPRHIGLLGAIGRERKTLRLDRIQDDPRSAGFVEGHPHMTSLLGVPIQLGSRLFGILYLSDREDGKPFSQQDQVLIETLAGYAALAIAGSELDEEHRRLALFEERQRISMELHDGVIQSLYAIGMQLDLERSQSGAVEGKDIDQAVRGLNAVIEDIRRYILNLKASDQEQKTVYQTLDEQIHRLHIPQTLTVEINAPESAPPVTAFVFEGICQILHEAASNVIRHADASHILIQAQEIGSEFVLVIQDNGQGFDLAKTNGDGLGLNNIRQRAMMHNGQVEIHSAPGQGTTLTIRVPL
jgi:signal transduction histidine kinase